MSEIDSLELNTIGETQRHNQSFAAWNCLSHNLQSIDMSLITSRKRLKAFLFVTDTWLRLYSVNLDFISDIIIIIIIIICTLGSIDPEV